MGQDISRERVHKYGVSYKNDLTLSPLRQKSVILPFDWKIPTSEELLRICVTEMPKTFEDLIVRRLSLGGRKIWNERSPQKDFNQYFLENLELLRGHIRISKDDIEFFDTDRNLY
jgi:glycerol-3-phosphate dehydrogenase